MKMLAIMIVLVAGCGPKTSENHGDHDHGMAGDSDMGTPPGGVDVYADGLAKTGEAGRFVVTLVGAEPAPPDVGDNVWTVRVTDLGDAPVDGAKVTVSPFMPAHGHGTSPADYTGTFDADGTYQIGPFDLFMPGVWETTVAVEDGDADEVTFIFELEG